MQFPTEWEWKFLSHKGDLRAHKTFDTTHRMRIKCLRAVILGKVLGARNCLLGVPGDPRITKIVAQDAKLLPRMRKWRLQVLKITIMDMKMTLSSRQPVSSIAHSNRQPASTYLLPEGGRRQGRSLKNKTNIYIYIYIYM